MCTSSRPLNGADSSPEAYSDYLTDGREPCERCNDRPVSRVIVAPGYGAGGLLAACEPCILAISEPCLACGAPIEPSGRGHDEGCPGIPSTAIPLVI